MRTNIDIDEKLVEEAMALSGEKTKKSVVEEGLRRLIQLEKQRKAFEEMKGIGWDGDLDAIRRSWPTRHAE